MNNYNYYYYYYQQPGDAKAPFFAQYSAVWDEVPVNVL